MVCIQYNGVYIGLVSQVCTHREVKTPVKTNQVDTSQLQLVGSANMQHLFLRKHTGIQLSDVLISRISHYARRNFEQFDTNSLILVKMSNKWGTCQIPDHAHKDQAPWLDSMLVITMAIIYCMKSRWNASKSVETFKSTGIENKSEVHEKKNTYEKRTKKLYDFSSVECSNKLYKLYTQNCLFKINCVIVVKNK